jgi:hypothetical protein
MVPLLMWPTVTMKLLAEAFKRPNKTSTIIVEGGNVTVETDGGDTTAGTGKTVA